MNVTHNQLVRGLQVITHLIAIPAVGYAVYQQWWGWLIAGFLAYWVTGIVGINIGLHRWLAHESFKTYRPVEYILMFCGVITTTGSPIAWSIVHRLHHRFTDQENDPHCPHHIGPVRAWFGAWNTSGFKHAAKAIRGMTRDPMLVFMHDHYVKIIVVYNLVLLLIHPLAPIFLYCVPAVLSLHSASGIIVIPHYHGYKNHDTKDTSRNSWIANLITMGEGWHNNHHAHPSRWNTQEKWWEWDLPAQIIKLIKQPERSTQARMGSGTEMGSENNNA